MRAVSSFNVRGSGLQTHQQAGVPPACTRLRVARLALGRDSTCGPRHGQTSERDVVPSTDADPWRHYGPCCARRVRPCLVHVALRRVASPPGGPLPHDRRRWIERSSQEGSVARHSRDQSVTREHRGHGQRRLVRVGPSKYRENAARQELPVNCDRSIERPWPGGTGIAFHRPFRG
jgi:hypothetical protein